jgi:2-dehydropantoate 2-reductase
MNLRTWVIGAGSIGLFLQYLLQPAVNSVLIARPASVDALRHQALTLQGAMTDQLMINCATTIPTTAEPSVVFIVTKAPAVLPLLATLASQLPPQSQVILCQNGIGLYDQVTQQYPHWKVMRLSCWMGMARQSLTALKIAGIFKFDLAANASNSEALQFWQAVLAQQAIPTTISTNPQYSEWQKALWNITVNGLCAILDVPNGAILDHPEIRAVAQDIMQETVAVAAQAGINLTLADQQAVFQSLEKTRQNINASLQDLRAGRATEIGFFNGAVVNLARKMGMRAPLNEFIVNIIKYLERQQLRRSAADAVSGV